MTPANIGEQLDERRATLIREALDFPEEFDSTEYCVSKIRKISVNIFKINMHYRNVLVSYSLTCLRRGNLESFCTGRVSKCSRLGWVCIRHRTTITIAITNARKPEAYMMMSVYLVSIRSTSLVTSSSV